MILMRKRGDDDDIFLDRVGHWLHIKKRIVTSVRFVKIFTFLYLKEIALYIGEKRYT